ncbi:hypothetical protein BpOF4_21919 (plasmid) [Alkalihalophilus pseudofirmus OF4]|uniref:Lipoprotein n=1 Tax=Alkalihalophilus pseudofirmus (strain ATCC BAA-2126 / JCM 17055 / OF4) TaxID=398511 RepID=D3G203_ALKPO|nr:MULTISPECIES: hypothetical protein [Alkalihalophilus]ADC52379.1 hypothetical protein BpOF4_21919 [Alkalihalophilus pseudofirmus OF4]MED1603444.1 hypothetical protein [Alkalihalophilus marmarensis]
MKRLLTTLLLAGVVLTGCGGNPLGLDEERLQEGVVERAMTYADVKEGDYIEQDIELVKVCAAVPRGKQEYGHQGDYVVFWQTKDTEVQDHNHFNESDYIVEFGANSYEEFEEIGCHNFKE